MIPIVLKIWVLYIANKTKQQNTYIQIYKNLLLKNSFILHIIPAPHKRLALPVRTKQQFSRDDNALKLHIAIALTKPSESTSGLLIRHFLRAALQRKSH